MHDLTDQVRPYNFMNIDQEPGLFRLKIKGLACSELLLSPLPGDRSRKIGPYNRCSGAKEAAGKEEVEDSSLLSSGT